MSWWKGDPNEIYWCEITGRTDIGADLKCPQRKADGTSYWSYDLIREIEPGHIVFHYSTEESAFVAASVAGGPVRSQPIIWRARGTTSRRKKGEPDAPPEPQPGWLLPLERSVAIDSPAFQRMGHRDNGWWIQEWVEQRRENGVSPTVPFQLYGSKTGKLELRASQGYLTKMPRDFVTRFMWLSVALKDLAAPASGRVGVEGVGSEPLDDGKTFAFRPKGDSSYLATVRAGVQERSRSHETLVNNAAQALMTAGADVVTTHPIDLRMRAPLPVIIEAKIVGTSAREAVREAVGQLYEYQHYYGPADAYLCILLDAAPDAKLQAYVEDVRGFLLCWMTSTGLVAGPRTSQVFAEVGLAE